MLYSEQRYWLSPDATTQNCQLLIMGYILQKLLLPIRLVSR